MVDEIDAGYDSRAAAAEDRSGDTADSGACCEATQAQCRGDGESDDGQAQRSADSATDSGADDGAEQAADLSAESELALEVRNRPIILLRRGDGASIPLPQAHSRDEVLPSPNR